MNSEILVLRQKKFIAVILSVFINNTYLLTKQSYYFCRCDSKSSYSITNCFCLTNITVV